MTNTHRQPRLRAGNRAAGFTLIEVLTAILVLAITIPVIVQAYTSAGDVAAISRQRVEALAVGQSALDSLVATGDWQQGTLQGEEQPGSTAYVWTAELTQWGDMATENANVQQLTLTVTWKHSAIEQSIVLDTLVYTPDTTDTSTGTLGGLQ